MRLPTHRAPFHPGVILLEEFLDPMEISQAAFARHIGWTTTKLSEIIKGKRGISTESALDLADVFQMSAGFWINLQRDYDVWQAMQHHKQKPPIAA